MNDFDRIFGPRLEKAVKAISLLANGVRYEPNPEQISKMISELETAVMEIRTAYGVKQEDAPAPAPAPAPTPAPAEGWKHHDIPKNVNSIPDNQLGSYATRIMARLCERLDT